MIIPKPPQARSSITTCVSSRVTHKGKSIGESALRRLMVPGPLASVEGCGDVLGIELRMVSSVSAVPVVGLRAMAFGSRMTVQATLRDLVA